MPALPDVSGVAKIIIKSTLASQNMYNILHASNPNFGAWSATDLGSLASNVRAAWVTNVLPLQASTVLLTDVQCIDLSSHVGLEATATGSNAGTAVGSSMPANVAITWSWKINRRYRGGHPRTYIGGIPTTTATNPSTIIASSQTAHATAAAAIRTAINGVTVAGGQASMCTVHYYKDKVLLASPLTSAVTGVSVDTRFDSQRRRLGRDR